MRRTSRAKKPFIGTNTSVNGFTTYSSNMFPNGVIMLSMSNFFILAPKLPMLFQTDSILSNISFTLMEVAENLSHHLPGAPSKYLKSFQTNSMPLNNPSPVSLEENLSHQRPGAPSKYLKSFQKDSIFINAASMVPPTAT